MSQQTIEVAMKEKASDFCNVEKQEQSKGLGRKRQRKISEETKGVEIAVPAKEECAAIKTFHILM